MARTPDLTYSAPDGFWTRFMPNTDAGIKAWEVMCAQMPDGIVAFTPAQTPDVLRQLKAAGLSVAKAKPAKPLSDTEIDAMLAELEA
jgi:hypothetical protein